MDVAEDEDKRLDQTEVGLGEHVTGGVVQSWRQIQKKLREVQSECKFPTFTVKLILQELFGNN